MDSNDDEKKRRGRGQRLIDALTADGRSALAGMPCVALFSCGRTGGGPEGADLVEAASSLTGADFSGAAREKAEVVLPASEWGSGRAVVVDRRYAPCGALLVVVQAARRKASASAEEVDGEIDGEIDGAEEEEEEEEGRGDDGKMGDRTPAVSPAAAGVLEVVKEVAASAPLGGGRRTVVLHLVCRLSHVAQRALARVVEAAHARTLFVLTCTRLSALDPRIASLSLSIPIVSRRNPKKSVVVVGGTANGSAWGTDALRKAALSVSGRRDCCDLISRLASAECAISRIRALGGDPPPRSLVQRLVSSVSQRAKK